LTKALDLGIEVSAGTFSSVAAAYVKVGDLAQADRWIARAAVEGVILARGGSGSSKAAARGWALRGNHVRTAAKRAPAEVPADLNTFTRTGAVSGWDAR